MLLIIMPQYRAICWKFGKNKPSATEVPKGLGGYSIKEGTTLLHYSSVVNLLEGWSSLDILEPMADLGVPPPFPPTFQ